MIVFNLHMCKNTDACCVSCLYPENPQRQMFHAVNEDDRCWKWEMEQVMLRVTEVLLPAHFLYRGVVQTEVHILGWCRVEKQKQKRNYGLCCLQ